MVELFISESKKTSDRFSARFADVLNTQFSEQDFYVSKEVLIEKLQDLTQNIEHDAAKAQDVLSYISDDSLSSNAELEMTLEAVGTLNCKQDSFVSLYAMALFAMNEFGVLQGQKDELVFSVLAASILGEIKNVLPYHNNYHYRKVMLHTIRLIRAHNYIYQGKKNALDAEAIFKLLIAAPIHDLGHDGRNNSASGTYKFAAIEQRSFGYAEPILSALGCGEERLADIRVMLLTTDVLPFGDPMSPVNQMAAAFDYHFGMSEEGLPELSSGIMVLEERADLTLLCMLLHGADIMNSMGLTYDITQAETKAINIELGKESVSAEEIWLFLNKICMNSMMSEAVQRLAEDSMKEIYGRVKREISFF